MSDNRVFVLDTNRTPLAPCHPGRARELLTKGKAAVFRMYPFTIILNRKIPKALIDKNPIRVKIDPGSRMTGLALAMETPAHTRCIFALNIEHRGIQIVDALTSRRQLRRSRRNRNCRYRPTRFDNRTKAEGWLPPSLESRLRNIETWIQRCTRLTIITDASIELVKFDMQKEMNSSIKGIEYQQGTLQGFKIKEYLLHGYNHTCQYCHGASGDSVLEWEHVIPKSRGGSDSIRNATLACRRCNIDKGNKYIKEWLDIEKGNTSLSKARRIHIPKVIKGIKPSFRDAAAVNAIRFKVIEYCKSLGFETEVGLEYRTKFNRVKQNYRKDHWIDASMVGKSGDSVYIPKSISCLTTRARKTNNRQMCLSDKYGFPRTRPKGPSKVDGFRTGDRVKAIISAGKYIGTHTGKVAVRTTGWFDVKTVKGTITVHHANCNILYKGDGYGYSNGTAIVKQIIAPTLGYINNVKSTIKEKFYVKSTKALDRVNSLYTVTYNV